MWKKTKEMIVDFSPASVDHNPLYINDELVENVSEYKYLGTIIDSKFNFNQNVDAIHKKAHSRLYFVRQLSRLHVHNKILELFYTSIVQSVIAFSIVCWYGNSSVQSKSKLDRVIKSCRKVGVENAASLENIFRKSTIQRCKVIINDQLHPLHNLYAMLPSCKRLSSIKCRTTRYIRSFVPCSVKLLNDLKLILHNVE